jgi:signal transduction histidine kinase
VTHDQASATVEHQALYIQSPVNDLLDDVRQHRLCILEGFARLDIRTIIQPVLGASEPVCVQRQLQTTARLPETPVWVDGDATCLQEILWNLVSNAVRYTPEGGAISVDVTIHDDAVIVSVTDTGHGLEREEIRRICRAFVRGGCGKPEGLGLGLAVAWALAQAHGGKIDIRSQGRGKGSEFRLVLPASV